MSNTEKSTKPSSADYPVDPVERSNQEARLKKAAAAGASASKSPLPGLMLQRPPTAAASKNVSEPKTLAKSIGSAQSTSETSNGQAATGITNDEILTELRNITVLVALQRKLTKQSLIFLTVYVPVVIGIFLLIGRQLKTNFESNLPAHQSDWSDVDRNVRQGDFEKGIAIGEELLLKTPQSAETHERLAKAYLAAGNVDKAKEHYAEAFRLFPSEENERLLTAIEKRISTDKP